MTISKIEKSSMLLWYPKIMDLDIPQPRTEIHRFTYPERMAVRNWLFNQGGDFPGSVMEQMRLLAQRIGFPLFLRTDITSMKHDWKNTCFVPSLSVLEDHVKVLLVASMDKSNQYVEDRALVLREYIPLETGMVAFHGDLPINKERRYFIRDGKVECHHPYWIPVAVKGHTREENWRTIVDELNYESLSEITYLTSLAELVGTRFNGYWSVDFSMGKDGRWYLFDMAEGIHSFHWLDCKFCPNRMLKIYESLLDEDKELSKGKKVME